MSELTLEMIIKKCQETVAHAWMVRTFVKHSDEAEEYPELMGITRSVFDLACALENRVSDPKDYLRMLGKKNESIPQSRYSISVGIQKYLSSHQL